MSSLEDRNLLFWHNALSFPDVFGALKTPLTASSLLCTENPRLRAGAPHSRPSSHCAEFLSALEVCLFPLTRAHTISVSLSKNKYVFPLCCCLFIYRLARSEDKVCKAVLFSPWPVAEGWKKPGAGWGFLDQAEGDQPSPGTVGDPKATCMASSQFRRAVLVAMGSLMCSGCLPRCCLVCGEVVSWIDCHSSTNGASQTTGLSVGALGYLEWRKG